MKKFAVILLAASFLTSSVFAADIDKVVASYKGGDVKESQVMAQYKSMLDMQPETKDKKFSELAPEFQNQLVRGYINAKLIEQEAKNSNVMSSKEIQEKLDNIKNQLVSQKIIEDYVKKTVNDQAITAEYDKRVLSLKGQNEVKVSHILVDSETKAKEVKNKLAQKTGKGTQQERFAALAKEYSTDDGSKTNGGELGYILKGVFVPDFENKAFSMKKDEISDPVQTQFGWHIIMVSDIRPARIPTKEEESARISSDLTRVAIAKYFDELSSKADVKINLPTAALVPNGQPATGATSAPAVDSKKPAAK